MYCAFSQEAVSLTARMRRVISISPAGGDIRQRDADGNPNDYDRQQRGQPR